MSRLIMSVSIVVLLLSSAAKADDPEISFTFNLGAVTVSIRGVESDTLHDEQTKAMLKRAAQLAHYSLKQLRWEKDFPACLKMEGGEDQRSPKQTYAPLTLECVKREK